MAANPQEQETERRLLDGGVTDSLQLAAARNRMRREGGTIPGNLVRLGLVSESRLLAALARSYGLSTCTPERLFSSQEDALDHLSFEEAYYFRVLPLRAGHTKGRPFLELAAADPVMVGRVAALPAMASLELKVSLAPERDLERAITKAYGKEAPPFQADHPLLREALRAPAMQEPPAPAPVELEVEVTPEPEAAAPLPPEPESRPPPPRKPPPQSGAGPAGRTRKGMMKEETMELEPLPPEKTRKKQGKDVSAKDQGAEKALLAIRVLLDVLEEKGVLTKEEFMDALRKAAEER